MLKDKLKAQRQSLGLTQQQAAELLNVTRQAISNWENGNNYPDIPTLIKISELYHISLDTLLKGDQDLMTKFQVDSQDLHYLRRVRYRFGIIGSYLFVHFGHHPKWGKGNFIFWLFTLTFAVYMNLMLFVLQLAISYIFDHNLSVNYLSELFIATFTLGLSPVYGWWAQDFLKK
ncbi:MAG TPA: hypothetical protein DDW71_08600 [Lactobacillus sp.]|nr:hypothetical protein [Lactobacillus sp.]